MWKKFLAFLKKFFRLSGSESSQKNKSDSADKSDDIDKSCAVIGCEIIDIEIDNEPEEDTENEENLNFNI